MKVLQLIDSLQPGGAERMAVNLANALSQAGQESFLVATRDSGPLEPLVLDSVPFLVLGKKNKWDLKAFWKLHKWVRFHKIEVIHAHSSSFFFGYVLKRINPVLRLIWHDHYGKSEDLSARPFAVLRRCSRYFDAIISVNHLLRDWALNQLQCRRVLYLPNFPWEHPEDTPQIELSGNPSMRLVCLANLRPQKDHLNLLNAFKEVSRNYPNATLHLLGKGNADAYQEEVMELIGSGELENVFYYGAQSGIPTLLRQCKIGILSSNSEGLPLALLEYGLAGLAVVTTDVGQCREVVNGYGELVPPGESQALAEAILRTIRNFESNAHDSNAYRSHIEKHYSFEAVYPKLMDIYHATDRT
jgi:glycosyltransferase involved in cell wall biosynthesis